MIWYSTPWSSDKCLGIYYNQFMQLIPEKDYACFTDADAMFTTNFYGRQLDDITQKHADCGLFTAMTNRIACKYQRSGDWHSNDMRIHRDHGLHLYNQHYDHVTDISKLGQSEPMGGVLIMISKKTWRSLGGFKESGLLGVDNDIHQRAMAKSEKTYLMTGLFMMHWYRGGDIKNRKHLL